MSIDKQKLRADVAGFAGRFFSDPERGDIGYIAKKCDDKECDCERKANADGEQDCSHSLYDWEGEDHINEPIVRMLNAVGPLLDENERLRKMVREACDAGNEALRLSNTPERDQDDEWRGQRDATEKDIAAIAKELNDE